MENLAPEWMDMQAGVVLAEARDPESLPGLPHGRAWVWQTYDCECRACSASRHEHEVHAKLNDRRPSDEVCRWRRSRAGDWVVEGPPGTVRPGATVKVATRRGTVSEVVLRSVGSTFLTRHGARRYGYTS